MTVGSLHQRAGQAIRILVQPGQACALWANEPPAEHVLLVAADRGDPGFRAGVLDLDLETTGGLTQRAGRDHRRPRRAIAGPAGPHVDSAFGVPPAETGLAPSVAIPKALDRAGLSVGDVSLWEINEAFASVSVAATRALGLDEDVVNVLGSGCSLGHPVAMTGARMVLTLTHELRRRGGGVGVAAMCAGGGTATALVLDVPRPA
jgi:Thiolase, C-terminal domain